MDTSERRTAQVTVKERWTLMGVADLAIELEIEANLRSIDRLYELDLFEVAAPLRERNKELMQGLVKQPVNIPPGTYPATEYLELECWVMVMSNGREVFLSFASLEEFPKTFALDAS